MKEKTYSAHNSSAKKAVERVFRILFKKSGIMSHPCHLADTKDIEQAALCCCILHNMVAQIRGYKVAIKF